MPSVVVAVPIDAAVLCNVAPSPASGTKSTTKSNGGAGSIPMM